MFARACGSSSCTEEDSYASFSRSRRSRRAERSSLATEEDSTHGGLSDGPYRPAVLYIQMQLCELTLRDHLKEEGRPASLEANKPYFLQLLAGLQHIHRNSLIHRDLTP